MSSCFPALGLNAHGVLLSLHCIISLKLVTSRHSSLSFTEESSFELMDSYLLLKFNIKFEAAAHIC